MPPNPSSSTVNVYPEVLDISWRTNLRYDPRLGDEDGDEAHTPDHGATLRHVRIETPSQRASPVDSGHGSREKPSAASDRHRQGPGRASRSWTFIVKHFPLDLAWIPNNWSWSKIKPIIRAWVQGWISVIFMVIPRVESVLGQVRFPSV